MTYIDSSVGKVGLISAALIALLISIGTGWARADTFRHGGSTAIIEPSGDGSDRSKVFQYQSGQTIITQSGNSTDITIQNETDFLMSDRAIGNLRWEDIWFDPRRFELRSRPDTYGFPEFSQSGDREAFKQQMLDRMRSRFRP